MSLGGGGSKTQKSTSTSETRVDRPPASPQERLLTDIGLEYYNDYMTRFAPVNQRVLDQVRAKEGRDLKPAMGRANADVHLAMQGKGREVVQQAMQGVGRSGSGRGLAAGLELGLARGKAVADAVGGARRNAQDQEFAGLQKLAAQGRDIQDNTVMSMAEAGNRATREALARTGRNSSSSSSFTRPGENDYSDWAKVAGMAGNALYSDMFGTPVPSYAAKDPWGAGVVPGNYSTSFGGLVKTPYYNEANDFYATPGASTSSSGGFFDSIGSSFGSIFSGGSSSGYGSGFSH